MTAGIATQRTLLFLRATPRNPLATDLHVYRERVTGIEPALSAWEAVSSGLLMWPDLRGEVPVSDRERPLVTGVNGPLMAR